MAEASGHAGMAPARVAGAPCRINALPDDILFQALSHMDTLQVVQTSVLSRRWRGLWRSVPRINATCHEFDGMADTEEERDTLFKAFVSRFLMLRNPTALDVFNFRYFVPEGNSIDRYADANLWIGHALQCNARSIHVSVWENKLSLDSSVFTSKCFLNSLELSFVILRPGFFESLQKGCTVLERLSLYECCIADPEICSQTLKVFTMDYWCYFSFFGRATISIPSLVSLGYFLEESIPLLANMESLETASVSVRTLDTPDTPVDDIRQVLRSIAGVTNLNSYYQGKTVKMKKNFQWCPKFNNLTILTLREWCLCGDFYALIVFLQNSPNLVKLTLELSKSQATHGTFIGDLEKRSFTCEHLKIIEIICLQNLEDDPVLNNLEKLLTENGITSGQIDIMHRK